MSRRATDAVWAVVGLPSTQKFVLLCLAQHANDADQCWPSLSLMAKETGFTGRGVWGALQELEAKGQISITQRGRNQSNVYTLLFPAGVEPNSIEPRSNNEGRSIEPNSIERPSRWSGTSFQKDRNVVPTSIEGRSNEPVKEPVIGTGQENPPTRAHAERGQTAKAEPHEHAKTDGQSYAGDAATREPASDARTTTPGRAQGTSGATSDHRGTSNHDSRNGIAKCSDAGDGINASPGSNSWGFVSTSPSSADLHNPEQPDDSAAARGGTRTAPTQHDIPRESLPAMPAETERGGVAGDSRAPSKGGRTLRESVPEPLGVDKASNPARGTHGPREGNEASRSAGEVVRGGKLQLLDVLAKLRELLPELAQKRRYPPRMKGEISTGLPGKLHHAFVDGFMQTQGADPPATMEDFALLAEWVRAGGLHYLQSHEWLAHICGSLPIVLDKATGWRDAGKPDPRAGPKTSKRIGTTSDAKDIKVYTGEAIREVADRGRR